MFSAECSGRSVPEGDFWANSPAEYSGPILWRTGTLPRNAFAGALRRGAAPDRPAGRGAVRRGAGRSGGPPHGPGRRPRTGVSRRPPPGRPEADRLSWGRPAPWGRAVCPVAARPAPARSLALRPVPARSLAVRPVPVRSLAVRPVPIRPVPVRSSRVGRGAAGPVSLGWGPVGPVRGAARWCRSGDLGRPVAGSVQDLSRRALGCLLRRQGGRLRRTVPPVLTAGP